MTLREYRSNGVGGLYQDFQAQVKHPSQNHQADEEHPHKAACKENSRHLDDVDMDHHDQDLKKILKCNTFPHRISREYRFDINGSTKHPKHVTSTSDAMRGPGPGSYCKFDYMCCC